MMDYEAINKLLECNPETGLIRWKERGKARKVGWFSGSKSRGYCTIRINGNLYRVHRVMWLLTYEEWPEKEIDHINGDRSDNRLSNLREATDYQNSCNAGLRKDNKSGVKGVCFMRDTGKWRAEVRRNGKTIRLGRFLFKHHAKYALEKFRAEHHGEFANNG